MKRREKSAAQLRRANRGNVPGVLGMAEMAVLSGKVLTSTSSDTQSLFAAAPLTPWSKCAKCDGSRRAVCTRSDCPQVAP